MEYYNLLDSVFGSCATIMNENSTIYVRTDRRNFMFNTALEILQRHFPKYNTNICEKPYKKKTQTEIHANKSKETGEIDIIMTR